MFGKTPAAAPPPRSRLPWPVRALAALIRGLTRALVWAARLALRYGWRYRKLLAPVYVSLWLAVAALALHRTPWVWVNIAGGTALAAVALVLWMRRRRRAGRKMRRARRVYAWSCLAAAAVWLATLTTWDVPLSWAAGVHAVLTAAAAGPWMWDRRVRRPAPLHPAQLVWDERLAAPGRRLAGTTLTNVRPGSGNVEWEGVIRGEPGLFITDTAVQAQRYIASAYTRAASTVIVEPEADEALHTARLLMVRANKVFATATYDESWHELVDGSVPLTVYPDGSRGRIAIWVPGAGTCSAFYSGDTASGKSKAMTAGVTQVTTTGLSVPWFGCPQGGQSSPAYAGVDGLADYIARDAEQCLEMLLALRGAMRARSGHLAELPYRTPGGRIRRGVARYEPFLTVVVDGREMPLWQHMPILDVTVDEIPQVFAYDQSAPLLVAEIVKLVSKTGGRLSIAAQSPVLTEIGGLDVIRQNVKSNVIALRNAEQTSKNMLLSPWMPSPWTIPAHPPGQPNEHTKGTCVLESVAPDSARATYSRVVLIEDDFDAAEAAVARRPALDEISAVGAGPDYHAQWQASPMAPKAVRPGWGRPAPATEPETPPAGEASARETVTAAPPAAAGGPREGTLAARAITYLAGRTEPASTSTIAQALGAPRGHVSQALGREADRAGSRVARVPGRRGMWTLTDRQQTAGKEAA